MKKSIVPYIIQLTIYHAARCAVAIFIVFHIIIIHTYSRVMDTFHIIHTEFESHDRPEIKWEALSKTVA